MSGQYKKQITTNAIRKSESSSSDQDDIDELFTASSIETLVEFDQDLELNKYIDDNPSFKPLVEDLNLESNELSIKEHEEQDVESKSIIAQPLDASLTDNEVDVEVQIDSFFSSGFDDEIEASVDSADPFGLSAGDEDFEVDTQVQSFSQSDFNDDLDADVDDTGSFGLSSNEAENEALERLNEEANISSSKNAVEKSIAKPDNAHFKEESKLLADSDKNEIKDHLKRVLTEKILESIDLHLDGLQVNIGNDIKPNIEPDNLKQTYSYNLTPVEYGYVYHQEKTKKSPSIHKQEKVFHETSLADSISKPYELTEELDLEVQFSEVESEEFSDIDEEELVDQLSKLPSSETKEKRDYSNILLVIFLVVIFITGVHWYYQSDPVSDFISNIGHNLNTFTDNVSKNIDSFKTSGSQ